jgi:hypothetical protein
LLLCPLSTAKDAGTKASKSATPSHKFRLTLIVDSIPVPPIQRVGKPSKTGSSNPVQSSLPQVNAHHHKSMLISHLQPTGLPIGYLVKRAQFSLGLNRTFIGRSQAAPSMPEPPFSDFVKKIRQSYIFLANHL